jgi:hypothetical protein
VYLLSNRLINSAMQYSTKRSMMGLAIQASIPGHVVRAGIVFVALFRLDQFSTNDAAEARTWHFVGCFSTRSEALYPYRWKQVRGIICTTQREGAHMRTVMVVVALMMVAGCTTTAELAAEDDATCIGYGFTPRTTDYAACRLQVAQAREDRDNRTRSAMYMGYMGYMGQPR